MKKLIYAIAAVAVAVPVVALAQSACNSGSCTKGDKDMAEAKEHMKKGAKAAKDAASEKMKEGKQAAKDAYEKSKPSRILTRTARKPWTMRQTGLPIRPKPLATLRKTVNSND